MSDPLVTMQNHLKHLRALRDRILREDGPNHVALPGLHARILEAEEGERAIKDLRP